MQKASRFHEHLMHFRFHTCLLCIEVGKTHALHFKEFVGFFCSVFFFFLMLFIHTSLWLQSSFISSLDKQQGLYRYYTAVSLALSRWEGGGARWGIAFIPGWRGGCHRDATRPDVRSLGSSSSECDCPCGPLLLRTRGPAARWSEPHTPTSETISSSVGWFFYYH